MSKLVWQHPEVPSKETTVSWRSEGQLRDTPAFREWLDREFPLGAAVLEEDETNADGTSMGLERRSFLKLMGASAALAGFGMAACRRPESYIVPYTKSPEWVIPGKATYYASAMPRATGAVPLVVTTFEGRPTKLGPNALHPDSGGTDVFAQASILDLYSPSRSRKILRSGKVAKRAELDAAIAAVVADKAAHVAFLFGADICPTRLRLAKELKEKFPNIRFYQYEALSGEASKALPDGARWQVDFSKADRIISLDCDFVATDSLGPVKDFFERRKPEGEGYAEAPSSQKMNRLYSVEAAYSLTGGMADHRLRVAPTQVLFVAGQIARELGEDLGSEINAISNEHQLAWIKGLVADLKAHRGRSLVLAGSRQPAALHHLALAINKSLGNIGEGKPLALAQTEATELGDLKDLIEDIQGGLVDTLFLTTPGNPVYDAPADVEFSTKVLPKLKASFHLGLRADATAHAATWHIPAAHYLESWSDARSARGVHTVVQPMILPLYPDCVSELELMSVMLSDNGKLLNGEGEKGAPSPAYDAVRKTFAALGGEGEGEWKKFLRDGFLSGKTWKLIEPTLAENVQKDVGAANLAAGLAGEPSTQALQVVFSTDASLLDGRWIDNGWLQEVPDPISKLTWDNAALIAPKTAKKLGIYEDLLEPEQTETSWGVDGKFAKVGPDGEAINRKQRMISIELNGKTLEIPVLVSFGQAENTLIIPLGYGQGFDGNDVLERGPKNAEHVGLVGVNRGFDAYPLRTTSSLYFATGAKVSKIEKTYPLALTQEHSAMYGRALAREVSTMAAHDEKGGFEQQLSGVKKQGIDSHAPPNVYLYQPKGSATWNPTKDGKAGDFLSDDLHQWGMSIDLSACMGCAACAVACQAENNIPIVGKEQVARGREMHWIRMDRYYATQENYVDADGNEKETPDWVRDNPVFVPQPVACVQCEAAPCETVCPVNATVHTEDGLNAMAYNRCIGTRYCANNCPYKARRFNFFDYNKRNPLIAHNLYRGPLGETQRGEAPHLQKNPNVTVRMRGVMEKCTYCVQRLKDSVIRQKRGQKQEALVAGKTSTEMQVTASTLRIPVDSVKVACQEACPARAITFGNLLDEKKSELGRAKSLERNYDLLQYIGTRPRTSYLARVKNPNPDMPDALFIGKSTIHMA